MKVFSKTAQSAVLLFLLHGARAQQKYTVSSPDKSVIVSIAVGDNITYQVSQDNKELISPSIVSFKTDAAAPGWKVNKTRLSAHSETLTPVIKQKTSTVSDVYNELHIDFKNGLSLEWRAFDNGIAWHWISHLKGKYKVLDEQAVFGFDKLSSVLASCL
jgi:alpha-glucosidase